MKANTHIRVDPEALALLRERAGLSCPSKALRKLLGLPPTGLKPGTKIGWKKQSKK